MERLQNSLTRAPRCKILLPSNDLHHKRFFKYRNYHKVKLHLKKASIITADHQDCPVFTVFILKFISKYLDNALINFA